MIRVNDKKRDIIDTVWSVLTSFGYEEVEKNENIFEHAKDEPGKYCWFSENTISVLNSGNITGKAKAETLAIGIEVAAALGIEYFYAQVFDEEVLGIASLFGFDGIVEKGTQKEKISIAKDGMEFATGEFGDGFSKISFDIKKIIDALILSGADFTPMHSSATLIFAEPNALGVAYEVAYNLRINGCIVELYTESEEIADAEEYADNKEINCIIRAYADGKLQIKDFVKDEIIETSLEDFLGFYDDEEDECDCGHHHHHGEGCNCH